MKKLVFVLLLCGLSAFPSWLLASGQKIVTASQVNGTWRNKSSIFKIWALGDQKLQVEFLLTYEYKTLAGMMANTGSGKGTALIEADTAILNPEGSDETCKITLKFANEKLIVSQAGECGFGLNVVADGIYRRVSHRKPKFGEI